MRRAACTLLIVMAFAASAVAQNRLSGSAKCAKPDKDYRIEVADQTGHVFNIIHVTCAYTKGEIAGIPIREEVDTAFYDISEDVARGQIAGVMNMANGDKVYIRAQSTLTLKAGAHQADLGKWSFSGGTGKLKGLKGNGTYRANIAADGTATAEIEGEYEVAR